MVTFGRAIAVLALVVVAFHWGAEFMAVDVCLDSGLVYDYATSQCRSDVEHLPYVPYTQRSGWVLASAFGVVVVGLALSEAAKRRR